jgi:hypothetical protein
LRAEAREPQVSSFVGRTFVPSRLALAGARCFSTIESSRPLKADG